MKVKSLIWLMFFTFIAVACSNDDDDDIINDGTDTQNIGPLVSNITFDGHSERSMYSYEFDEKGRIITLELQDSIWRKSDDNRLYRIKPRNKTYCYHYVSDKLIVYKEDIVCPEEDEEYIPFDYGNPIIHDATPAGTYHFSEWHAEGYDTLFISNNRIDSIVRHVDFLSTNTREEVYTFALKYSENNRLTNITEYYYTRDKINNRNLWELRTYNYEVNWEGDNIASITTDTEYLTSNGKLVYSFNNNYTIQPLTFSYNDTKAYLPSLNVFTILFGQSMGILANQGLMGKLPVNLLSNYVPYPEAQDKTISTEHTIEYTFENGKVKYCRTTEDDGRYPRKYGMFFNWK